MLKFDRFGGKVKFALFDIGLGKFPGAAVARPIKPM